MRYLAALLMLWPALAGAEYVVAERTLRAGTIITASDVGLQPGEHSGALSDPALAIGMEARRAIYQGRAIREADIGPPALVERNQIVTLMFTSGTISIATEGRALARGGIGDIIRVMNLSSRTTITGRIDEGGQVIVSQ